MASDTNSNIVNWQRELRVFAQERDWEQFHTPKNLAMALTAEAGELLEHFQWLSGEQSNALNSEQRRVVGHEMADVFLYLLRMADVLGVDLAQATNDKLAINRTKYPADMVRGSAKKSTEYDK